MLYYITSNTDKVNVARKYLTPLGIAIKMKSFDFTEIQSESIEKIAEHKAQSAFERLRHPLIVNDAAWHLPALNGFPGPYMKYINDWFTSSDLLQLMQGKPDRTVIYEEVFYYIDGIETKTFVGNKTGEVLESPQGSGSVSWELFTLSSTKKSIAQCWEEGIDPVDGYSVWEDIAEYFKHKKA